MTSTRIAPSPRTARGTARTRAPILLAASALTIMAAAIISPSLPAMGLAFPDASPVLLRQTVTLTSAAIAAAAPLAGIAIRRTGSRTVLVGGLALYAVGGTAGLWLPGLGPLLISRLVLGVGVGMVMTAISSSIAGLWGGVKRTRMLAGQQAFASLGGVVFLPLAGLLAAENWRAPSMLYAVALLLVPLALRTPLLPGSRRRHRGPREPHAQGARTDRASSGLAVLVVVVAVLGTAVFFMAPTQLPFMFAQSGLAPVMSSLAIAASTATGVLGALAYPALRGRLGFAALIAGALLILGLGWAVIGLSGTDAPLGVITGALVGGVGVGAIVPGLNAWMSEIVPGPHRSTALGGVVAGVFGGQFLSPLLLAPVIGAIGLRGTFLVSAVALALLAATVVAAGARTHSGEAREERTDR
ncbi:MFS transporter [Brachybacterium subflavum]|uniref:MFS transporter n=1 Tax=Brachybacterium subflavum TaxID=2585206 RepID=UPI001266379E|nr:MFS transporter [Brachybacterium subflavum]